MFGIGIIMSCSRRIQCCYVIFMTLRALSKKVRMHSFDTCIDIDERTNELILYGAGISRLFLSIIFIKFVVSINSVLLLVAVVTRKVNSEQIGMEICFVCYF